MTDGRRFPEESVTHTQTVTQPESQTVNQEWSTSSTPSTHSLTGARARAYAHAREGTDIEAMKEDLKQALTAYARSVDNPDRYTRNMIGEYIEEGMELPVILSAIKDTSRAPRPSKRYLEAILRRYRAQGIMTYTDVLRDQDLHELNIQSLKRRRHARWYDDDKILTEYERTMDDPWADVEDGWIEDFLPHRDTTEVLNEQEKLFREVSL